jgi:hypothetical protein
MTAPESGDHDNLWDRMARRSRFSMPKALGMALCIACGMLASDATADSRTQFLIDRLKADDFRVRTNAALQLGGTNDPVAVQPLCGALDDSSDVVRTAAAAALQRLGKSEALPCLKSHKDKETNANVKAQITRAIEALGDGSSAGGGGADDPPKFVPTAKIYVALSPVSNRTNRPQGDVEKVVAGAIRQKLGAMPDYQLAPKQETPDAARAVISKRKFKSGYYLAIAVDPFDYSNGNLKVRVKVAISSYPGKDLKGEVPVGLTQTGVRPGDRGAEDNLMAMAAQRAIEQFAQFFQ